MKLLSAILATLVAQSFLFSSLWAQSPGGIGNTDLQLWLRSDMGISVSGNNVPVPIWEDQGPLLNHTTQTSPIAQHLIQAKRINGYPALRFNFADRFMEVDLSTLSNGNCSTSTEKTISIDSALSIDNDVFAEEFNVGFTIDGIFVQHKYSQFNGIINVYNMLGQKLIPNTSFQSQIKLQVPVYNNYVLIDIYSPETGQRTFIKRIR